METIKLISSLAFPMVFVTILLIGMYMEVKVYDTFVEGAKEGVKTVLGILPSLIGLFVSISVFRQSGALDLIIYSVKPLTSVLNLPSEVLPLAFLRPLSGSASLALVSDIIKSHGPDSYIGMVASTMLGSSETIFYTLAVYFGSVGIKKIRYTLIAALIAEFASVLASVYICSYLFQNS